MCLTVGVAVVVGEVVEITDDESVVLANTGSCTLALIGFCVVVAAELAVIWGRPALMIDCAGD